MTCSRTPCSPGVRGSSPKRRCSASGPPRREAEHQPEIATEQRQAAQREALKATAASIKAANAEKDARAAAALAETRRRQALASEQEAQKNANTARASAVAAETARSDALAA